MNYITTIDEIEYKVEILDERHVSVNGVLYEVDFESVSGQPVYSLLIEGRSYEGLVYSDDEGWYVLLQGMLYGVQVEDARERRLRAAAGGEPAERSVFYLKAPMPGLVVEIPVEAGQQVEKGDVLLVLESMKMQNELKSPRAGTVGAIRIEPGDSVDPRETLITIE